MALLANRFKNKTPGCFLSAQPKRPLAKGVSMNSSHVRPGKVERRRRKTKRGALKIRETTQG